MNQCRAERRRQQRNAARGCLTVGDAARLDDDRRLPDDLPSIVRAKRKGITQAQLDVLRSEVIRVTWEEAHPILVAVRRSPEFKRLQAKLRDDHPGPKSRLAHDLLMTAVIIAADRHNHAWRSIVCQVINGMSSRLWHQAGMCDHQSRGDPISFNTIVRQLHRLEHLATGVHPNEHRPPPEQP